MNKDNELVDELALQCAGWAQDGAFDPNDFAEEIYKRITKHNCQEAVEAVNSVEKGKYKYNNLLSYEDAKQAITTRLMGESDE